MGVSPSHLWVPPTPTHGCPPPPQTFDPVSAFDTGDYYCEAYNNVGTAQRSDTVRMEASEGWVPWGAVGLWGDTGCCGVLWGGVGCCGMP